MKATLFCTTAVALMALAATAFASPVKMTHEQLDQVVAGSNGNGDGNMNVGFGDGDGNGNIFNISIVTNGNHNKVALTIEVVIVVVNIVANYAPTVAPTASRYTPFLARSNIGGLLGRT